MKRSPCEQLSEDLRKIVDSSHSLSLSGSVSDGVRFAEGILEFAFTRNDQKEEGLLSQNLKNIGSVLKDLETMRSILLEQLESIFTAPLEQFLELDVQGALEMKKKVTKARDQYDAAQRRYELARSSKKKKDLAHKFESEVSELKKAYDLTTTNYQNRLARIDAKKSFEVLERLGTYMYATLTFFQQGYDMLSDLEPSLRELMAKLDQQRKSFVAELLKQESKSKKVLENSLDKQGQLFLRVGRKNESIRWKRRWCVTAEGELHIYKTWKELEPIQSYDMFMSAVRVLSEDEPPHKSFAFSVALQSKETLVLQAASEKDRSEWIQILNNAIRHRLQQSQTTNKAPSLVPVVQQPLEQLRTLCEANRFCADCNQKDPDWVAVNLGVLLCGQCADVHRDLDDPSPVKSLLLDKLQPELLMLTKTIGNEVANGVWEYNASVALKPSNTSDRIARERYIKAKYELRQFIRRPEISTSTLQEQLLDSLLANDVIKVYQLLSQGASLDHQDANKRSVLHHAMIVGGTSLLCLELLIQSGAKVNLVDDINRSPLHYAALHDRAPAARLLIQRGANIKLKDNEGKTPQDLANEARSRNYQSILSSEDFDEEGRKRSRSDRVNNTSSRIRMITKGLHSMSAENLHLKPNQRRNTSLGGEPGLHHSVDGLDWNQKASSPRAATTPLSSHSAPFLTVVSASPRRSLTSPPAIQQSTFLLSNLLTLKQTLTEDILSMNEQLEKMKGQRPPSEKASQQDGSALIASKLRAIEMILEHDFAKDEASLHEILKGEFELDEKEFPDLMYLSVEEGNLETSSKQDRDNISDSGTT